MAKTEDESDRARAERPGGARPASRMKLRKPTKKLSPLDVLLANMRSMQQLVEDELEKPPEAQDGELLRMAMQDAKEMAGEAAAFVHEKLSAVTRKSESLDLSKLSREELVFLLGIVERATKQADDAEHRRGDPAPRLPGPPADPGRQH